MGLSIDGAVVKRHTRSEKTPAALGAVCNKSPIWAMVVVVLPRLIYGALPQTRARLLEAVCFFYSALLTRFSIKAAQDAAVSGNHHATHI